VGVFFRGELLGQLAEKQATLFLIVLDDRSELGLDIEPLAFRRP